MAFLATVYPSPRPQPMKFPVFSLLAGNLAFSETTADSRHPTIYPTGVTLYDPAKAWKLTATAVPP